MHEIDLKKPKGIILKVLNILSLIAGSILLWESFQLNHVVLFVIGCVLVVSYFLSLSQIDKLRYDKEKKTITRKKGFVIPIPFKNMGIDDVQKVELRSEQFSSKKGEKVIYQLVLAGEKEYVLITGDPLYIRRKGEEVASELRLSLTNNMFAKSTTRRFSELNTPLLEQWKKKKFMPKRPLVKTTRHLDIKESDKNVRIIIPTERLSLKTAGIILGAIVLIALFFYPILGEYKLLYYALFSSTIILVGCGLLVLATPARLIINARSVIYREGIFLVSNAIKINQIEEIISHVDELVIIGDHKYLLVRPKLNKKEFEALHDLIIYQLYKRGKKSVNA